MGKLTRNEIAEALRSTVRDVERGNQPVERPVTILRLHRKKLHGNQDPSGAAGGDGLLHRGGADAARAGDLLRAVFHPSREPPGEHRRRYRPPGRAVDAADRPERDHGGMRCAARLPLSPARSRHQVHPILPGDHRVRPGRAACAACAQPEPECLCGALGQVGEGGVPVQGGSVRRALAAASAERICRALPCRAQSSGEGQRPAVPSDVRAFAATRSVQCRERLGGLLRYYHQEAA